MKIRKMYKYSIQMRWLIYLATAFLTSNSLAYDGTALGEKAKSMAPGTWAELPTNNLKSVLKSPTNSGSSGHILPFANEFMWHDASKKAFYIGGDHDGGPEKFIEYDAKTNTWVEKPRPFWMSTVENQNHSYSYMGIDPQGKFWYRETVYDITTGTWEDKGDGGQHYSSTSRGRKAFAFLPGMGTFNYFEGAVYILDENSEGPWRQIRKRFELGCSDCMLSNIATENRVTNKILFGGSDNSDQLYLIDLNENIKALGPTPLSQISMNGDFTSLITVDPVTGYFLVVADSGKFYEFDAEADRWSVISENTPLSTQPQLGGWQNDIIASTVSSYQVSVFVRWIQGAEPKMWIYKHSKAQIDNTPPLAPTNLQIQ